MLDNGDVVTMTHKSDNFLYHMASVVVEAHPFLVPQQLICYKNLVLRCRQTQTRLNDPTAIPMFGQLNGYSLELEIELSLKVVVVISVNIGKNDLNHVVTSLII